jgi:peptide/nickel transport system ATP-binding protein
MRSMPGLVPPGQRLNEIPGVVPPPDEWPAGCRFTSRCSRALPHCGDVLPGPTAIDAEHRAWCHAVAEELA